MGDFRIRTPEGVFRPLNATYLKVCQLAALCTNQCGRAEVLDADGHVIIGYVLKTHGRHFVTWYRPPGRVA